MDQVDIIAFYDKAAEAAGWSGPEVAFGLTFAHIQSGQSMLDIGIGTGLGLFYFLKKEKRRTCHFTGSLTRLVNSPFARAHSLDFTTKSTKDTKDGI